MTTFRKLALLPSSVEWRGRREKHLFYWAPQSELAAITRHSILVYTKCSLTSIVEVSHKRYAIRRYRHGRYILHTSVSLKVLHTEIMFEVHFAYLRKIVMLPTAGRFLINKRIFQFRALLYAIRLRTG
jgi:hypothetical protein